MRPLILLIWRLTHRSIIFLISNIYDKCTEKVKYIPEECGQHDTRQKE